MNNNILYTEMIVCEFSGDIIGVNGCLFLFSVSDLLKHLGIFLPQYFLYLDLRKFNEFLVILCLTIFPSMMTGQLQCQYLSFSVEMVICGLWNWIYGLISSLVPSKSSRR